jgi:hypothetical protein
MPLLTRNQLLLAKVEATEGVDAAPTASLNAIFSEPVDVTPDITRVESNAVRASISTVKYRIGRKKVNFSIRVELKGSGVPGIPPEVSPLLQACALKETIFDDLGSEKVTYNPVSSSSDQKSSTIYYYYDGKLIKGIGCKGNCEITIIPGEVAIMAFSLEGRHGGESDASLPNDAIYQDTVPAVAETGGVKIGSFSDGVFSNIGLSTANEIVDRLDVNSVEGLKGTMIVGRDPSLDMTVEATTEAVKAWWGNFVSRVEESVNVKIGDSEGNTVEIEVPNACISDGASSPRDSNGLVTYDLSFQALEGSGDDNFTITFK